MTREQVEELVDAYGLERILQDSETDLIECLQILDELGYIYLEMYNDV